MSIDPIPELDLERVNEKEALNEITGWERKRIPVVTLYSPLDRWDLVTQMLCTLRSAGISAVLLLKKAQTGSDRDDLFSALTFLHHWDQLLLLNFLELCGQWVPAAFLARLSSDAKIELKWFREWLAAVNAPRIDRYPGLPWRKFIRKTVGENYAFATHFLTLIEDPNPEMMQTSLMGFVESKKKVVCVFPKRWGKG